MSGPRTPARRGGGSGEPGPRGAALLREPLRLHVLGPLRHMVLGGIRDRLLLPGGTTRSGRPSFISERVVEVGVGVEVNAGES